MSGRLETNCCAAVPRLDRKTAEGSESAINHAFANSYLSRCGCLLDHISGPGAEFTSPGGGLSARIEPDSEGRLVWSLRRGDAILIEPSRLGISVNGTDLGCRGDAGRGEHPGDRRTVCLAWVKAYATNRCRTTRWPCGTRLRAWSGGSKRGCSTMGLPAVTGCLDRARGR